MDLEELAESPWFGDIIKEYLALLDHENLPPLKPIIVNLEADLINRALALCKGNKAAASRILSMNRTTIQEVFRRKSFQDKKVMQWAYQGVDRRYYHADRDI